MGFESLYSSIGTHSFYITLGWIGTILILLFVLSWNIFPMQPKFKTPLAGYRSWLEPTFLVRLRFIIGAKGILTAGYHKFKNEKFIIRRNDVDILMMSNTYLDELRLLPHTVLSNVRAQYENLMGCYTYASTILNSDLHKRVLRNQLTPRLAFYVERAKAEFDSHFEHDFPQADEWTEVDIQLIVRTVVARMTGAVFLGYPICRNDDWLHISAQYPIDTFQTAFTIRMFPRFLHPLLALLLPSRHRIRQHLIQAEELITPLIESQRRNAKGKGYNHDTLFSWMIDNATDAEATPAEMTSRVLILTLASIHTTTLALSHALFDLCAHPEHLSPIRQEIEDVMREHEGVDFVHQGLPRLEKLDSFLAESQRFNPPVLMAPQRIAMESITLRDGTHIPRGTRLGFAAFNVLMDPTVTPEPEHFDGFRAYRKREQPGQRRNNFLVHTDKNHLAFGHGTQACPGKHFAAAELKIVLACMLTKYDFKFVDGKGRPKTLFFDENCFPDPAARLMLRHRTV